MFEFEWLPNQDRKTKRLRRAQNAKYCFMGVTPRSRTHSGCCEKRFCLGFSGLYSEPGHRIKQNMNMVLGTRANKRARLIELEHNNTTGLNTKAQKKKGSGFLLTTVGDKNPAWPHIQKLQETW